MPDLATTLFTHRLLKVAMTFSSTPPAAAFRAAVPPVLPTCTSPEVKPVISTGLRLMKMSSGSIPYFAKKPWSLAIQMKDVRATMEA